jgi:hypothetical protein
MPDICVSLTLLEHQLVINHLILSQTADGMIPCAGLRLAVRKMSSSSSLQQPPVLQVLASSVAIANRAGQVGAVLRIRIRDLDPG